MGTGRKTLRPICMFIRHANSDTGYSGAAVESASRPFPTSGKSFKVDVTVHRTEIESLSHLDVVNFENGVSVSTDIVIDSLYWF